MSAVLVSTLLTDALVEINAVQAGSAAQPDVFAVALRRLILIVDQMNANGRKLYADLYSTFTITPSLNPHTIGPTGATWTYAIDRPQDIESASLILNTVSAPFPYVPMVKLTAQQWQNLTVPGLTSPFANYFYYNPTMPLGSFYFWTVETLAYQVQLKTRQQVVGALTVNTTLQLPQGYPLALMMTLARSLKGPLRKPWTTEQEQIWTNAIGEAYGPNAPDLNYATADLGMPVAGVSAGSRQDFNYLSGQLTD